MTKRFLLLVLSVFLVASGLAQTFPKTPATLALIRTGSADATATVEFWDGNGNELPSLNAVGAEFDFITITVSSTAKSLPQFISQAGYNAVATQPGIAGIPNGAVGCSIICSSGSASTISYNWAGTANGGLGAGNGIQGTLGRAPSASSPNVMQIGRQLVVGTARTALPSSSPANATLWDNSGSAITTAVTVDAGAAGLCHYSALNTSASTYYYIEFFAVVSGSVTLGTTVPILIMVVPPGPNGTVEHYDFPLGFAALSVAFVTAPNGSSAAAASTCWATVSYR